MGVSRSSAQAQVTHGRKAMAGSLPVTMASDQPPMDASGATPVVTPATGAGAIAASYAPSAAFWLRSVTCHFSGVPAVAGDYTVTLNASDGAVYDTLLDVADPSVAGVQDLVYQPLGGPLLCEAGDAIDVAYANGGGDTYGVRIMTTLA